jgi:hypothetical protein
MLRMGSLRYSVVAGAAELAPAAPGLRQSSPFFRHALRCSASCRAGKSVEVLADASLPGGRHDDRFFLQTRHQAAIGVFFLPLCTAEQRSRAGEFGEDCLSPRAARASYAAARPGEQRREVRSQLYRERTGAAGSPFLWLLSFGEAKESTPARLARKPADQQLGSLKRPTRMSAWPCRPAQRRGTSS